MVLVLGQFQQLWDGLGALILAEALNGLNPHHGIRIFQIGRTDRTAGLETAPLTTILSILLSEHLAALSPGRIRAGVVIFGPSLKKKSDTFNSSLLKLYNHIFGTIQAV